MRKAINVKAWLVMINPEKNNMDDTQSSQESETVTKIYHSAIHVFIFKLFLKL
jgi:hypothetical protein